MNADAMAFLARKGLSLDEAIELARILEAAPKPKSKAALRQARYRARKEAENVTSDVTSDVTPPLNEYISKPPPSETKVSSERVKRASRDDCPKPLEPISSEAKASSEKRAGKVDQFPCPAGVDRIDWQALLQNRKQKRAALSEGAHRQIVKKLNEWERDGWPPGPIVAHAAEMGWTSVFPTDEMKAKQNGRLPTSHNFRPEPAMALKRIAEAELAAEGSSSDQEFGFGTGLALPDYLTN